MKKLILGLIMMIGSFASANVISTEFTVCSDNSGNICALVYSDLTTGVNYGGQEMGVSMLADQATQDAIHSQLSRNERTLAMNIEGRVVTVQRFAGSRVQKLEVHGTTDKGPRPRGL